MDAIIARFFSGLIMSKGIRVASYQRNFPDEVFLNIGRLSKPSIAE